MREGKRRGDAVYCRRGALQSVLALALERDQPLFSLPGNDRRGQGACWWSARPSPPSRIGKLVSAKSARCSTSMSRLRTRRPAARSTHTRRTTGRLRRLQDLDTQGAWRLDTQRRDALAVNKELSKLVYANTPGSTRSRISARLACALKLLGLTEPQTITGINTGNGATTDNKHRQHNHIGWFLVWSGLAWSLLERRTSRRTSHRTTPLHHARRGRALRPLAEHYGHSRTSSPPASSHTKNYYTSRLALLSAASRSAQAHRHHEVLCFSSI